MIGRREPLAGFARLALPLVLTAWSLAFAGLGQSSSTIVALGAASLVATAVLIALGVAVAVIGLPQQDGSAGPLFGSRRAVAVPVIRSSDPDSAGRPRPRAPGCAPDAHASR
jgi:Family of unknown function (DUF6412)